MRFKLLPLALAAVLAIGNAPALGSGTELIPLSNGLQVVVDPQADGEIRGVRWDTLRAQLPPGLKGSMRGIINTSEPQATSFIYVDQWDELYPGAFGYRPVNFCVDFTEAHCNAEARKKASTTEGASMRIGGVLGQDLCRSSQDFYCIESVIRRDPVTGVETELELLGTSGQDIQGVASEGIPTGVRGLLYRDPNNPSITYSVSGQAIVFWNLGELEFNRYKISITPTTVLTGNYAPEGKPYLAAPRNSSLLFPTRSGASHEGCAWITMGSCGMATPFPPASEFELTMRIPKELGGWLVGRVASPTLAALESVNSRSNRITVSAEPVKVPSLLVFCDEACFAQRGMPFNEYGGYSGGDSTGRFDFLSFGGTASKSIADQDMANLRSSGQTSLWSLSLRDSFLNYGKCTDFEDRIIGISGSDSMFMQSTPPEKIGAQLEFRIAGTHLDHRGEVEYGNYSAYVNSKFMGCVAGFNVAPSSAAISVIASDSGEVVSTQTVGVAGPWIKLEATNITFSEKQIRFSFAGKRLVELKGFSKTTKKLSSSHKKAIAKATKKLVRQSVSCTATYSADRDRSTALARAKAACSYLKSLKPRLKLSAKTFKTQGSTAGRVELNISS